MPIMKLIRLFALPLALSILGLGTTLAQSAWFVIEEYTPSIYVIGHEKHDKHAKDALVETVKDDYSETARHGFQQSHNPQVIFTTPDNRFSLAFGGFINLRTSYDLKGAVDNIDFVTYNIPMTDNYANRQRVMMDATTSRLFTKAIIHSRLLGRVVVYGDMDFRGGEEFSYIPRLRSAYVQFKGLTIGRDVTTFCDLNAAPQTIDFQGPNAYNFNFNQMIRYEFDFYRNRFRFGVAAEMPGVNGTYGEYFSAIPQRVPDGIAYLQYSWGENKSSHLRVSTVLRDMYLHNKTTNENTTQLGWGVQLSGHINIMRWVDLYMNGVYGKGITPYIQDLAGSPYDFGYNPADPTKMQTMPMWGWQIAGQVNIIPGRLWAAAGYSEVRLNERNGYLSDDEYRRGQYMFCNAFCNITSNFTVALEYLHGTRENMNESQRTANRLSIMAQYNF